MPHHRQDESSIHFRAKAAGLKPATVYNRIHKGMSVEDALATPPRKYNGRPRRDGSKAQRVWTYLLQNKLAKPSEVAKATGVSYGYVYSLMKKVGTPREVFEREEAIKQIDAAWDEVSRENRAKRIVDDAPRAPWLWVVGITVAVVTVTFIAIN